MIEMGINWSTLPMFSGFFNEVIRTIIFGAGVWIAYNQLKWQYILRRLQTLISLNERLAKYGKADIWISNPSEDWSRLTPDVKQEYIGYIATFEDIGLARTSGVISKHDFLISYGGRYKKLYESRTLVKYMLSEKFEPIHFERLEILNLDIGVPTKWPT